MDCLLVRVNNHLSRTSAISNTLNAPKMLPPVSHGANLFYHKLYVHSQINPHYLCARFGFHRASRLTTIPDLLTF